MPWLVGFLLCWLGLVLGTVFFARELQALEWWGWQLGYWMAAQGVVFGFIAIVGGHALVMRRLERRDAAQTAHAPQEGAAAPPGS